MNQNSERIEERLREEKPMYAAPYGFKERVMSQLPERRLMERNSAEPRWMVWPRLAIAACLLVVGGFFAFDLSRSNSDHATLPRHHPATVTPSIPSGSQMATADFSIPVITPEQLQALTVKLNDPLNQELSNVISDTRQAIQFVASNFLPEK